MVEALCIDDLGKPEEIKESNWVVKDNKYHITLITYHPMQGIQGCELLEVSTNSEMYDTYRLDRFAFKKEDLSKLLELIEASNELKDVDLEEALKEIEELQTI